MLSLELSFLRDWCVTVHTNHFTTCWCCDLLCQILVFTLVTLPLFLGYQFSYGNLFGIELTSMFFSAFNKNSSVLDVIWHGIYSRFCEITCVKWSHVHRSEGHNLTGVWNFDSVGLRSNTVCHSVLSSISELKMVH